MARVSLYGFGLIAGLLFAAPSTARAQDSDGDGVPDAADAFPCDASASAVAYAPGLGQHGLFIVEDQWPAAGDLDFNDLVLAYGYTFQLNAAGQVVVVRATFDALALGGIFDNGLGLALPVARQSAASVTRRIGGGAPEALTPSPSDANLTLRLSTNLRELFDGRAGQINSVPGEAAHPAHLLELEIAFAQPVALDIAQAPFDLFVFRSADPSHEIHRPEHAGTSAMNAALFGTASDRSVPSRWFTDEGGLPFALLLPTAAGYPQEGVAISSLFPRILDFAASGGAAAQDFYAVGVNEASRFSGGPSARFGGHGSFAADTACLVPALPVFAGTCPEIFNQAEHDITINGITRTFLVRLPWNPVGAPVVFSFGWGGSQPTQVLDHMGLGGLTVEGVISVAPRVRSNWAFRSPPDQNNNDLMFFDAIVACLNQQFSIDPDRIYATGFSIGGLWASYLGQHRAGILAAVAPVSGGLFAGEPIITNESTPRVYTSPAYPVSVMLTWGGIADFHQGSSTFFDFHQANLILSQRLRADGHSVVECEGSFAHTLPTGILIDEVRLWDFFRTHPRGVASEPFLGGFPPSYPSWCRIPPVGP